MTPEQIKSLLAKCHINEDNLNKEMSDNNKKILLLRKRNGKIAVMVSKNMKFRNQLIQMLNEKK